MAKHCALLLLLLLLFISAIASTAKASSEESNERFVTLHIGSTHSSYAQAATTATAAAEEEEEEESIDDGDGFRIPLQHTQAPSSPLRINTTTISTTHLLISTLHKDSLRSKAIAARIRIAANNLRISDLTTPSSSFPSSFSSPPSSSSTSSSSFPSSSSSSSPPSSSSTSSTSSSSSSSSFESPVSSGINSGSGDYFARIGVGTPAKLVYLVADTGSDVSWLQCTPCKKCYEQKDPLFNPSLSTTFKNIPCTSSSCTQLKVRACTKRSKQCLYQVSYGDGSFTVGDFSKDTLTLSSSSSSSSSSSKSIPNVAMGCGRNNQGLFHGAAGLLGLGRGPLSFPSQTGSHYHHLFSYCLPTRESKKSAPLIFGSNAVPSSAKFTPIIPNPKLDTYYYVGLAHITVGGAVLKIPSNAFRIQNQSTGGVIVDSGTAVTRLTTPAYQALRNAFRAAVAHHLSKAPGISLFDTCYDLSGMRSVRLPAIVFQFDGGASMAIPANGIMVAIDDVGTYCLAFAPEDEAFSIIGNVQQQTFRISIDNHRNLMGIAPKQCT